MKYVLLIWLSMILANLNAQEVVPVLGFQTSPQGTPLLTITTQPGSYYVLFGPQGRARTLVPGTGNEAVLTEALAARPAEQYTIRRYASNTPQDLDNDAIDDLTEYNNTPNLSPFNPTPALDLIDGAALIPDRATFDSLAFPSVIPSNNNPLTDRDLVKIYITDNDAEC